MLTQLIIGDSELPEVEKGQYSAYEDVLGEQIEMASGRVVTEQRGTVWRIAADYSDYYFTQAFWQSLSAVLRSGAPFQASFLPDNGTELLTSTFIVESLTQPTYRFNRKGEAYWSGVAFTLREERPHA